jgi:hypothetical protein
MCTEGLLDHTSTLQNKKLAHSVRKLFNLALRRMSSQSPLIKITLPIMRSRSAQFQRISNNIQTEIVEKLKHGVSAQDKFKQMYRQQDDASGTQHGRNRTQGLESGFKFRQTMSETLARSAKGTHFS